MTYRSLRVISLLSGWFCYTKTPFFTPKWLVKWRVKNQNLESKIEILQLYLKLRQTLFTTKIFRNLQKYFEISIFESVTKKFLYFQKRCVLFWLITIISTNHDICSRLTSSNRAKNSFQIYFFFSFCTLC